MQDVIRTPQKRRHRSASFTRSTLEKPLQPAGERNRIEAHPVKHRANNPKPSLAVHPTASRPTPLHSVALRGTNTEAKRNIQNTPVPILTTLIGAAALLLGIVVISYPHPCLNSLGTEGQGGGCRTKGIQNAFGIPFGLPGLHQSSLGISVGTGGGQLSKVPSPPDRR